MKPEQGGNQGGNQGGQGQKPQNPGQKPQNPGQGGGGQGQTQKPGQSGWDNNKGKQDPNKQR